MRMSKQELYESLLEPARQVVSQLRPNEWHQPTVVFVVNGTVKLWQFTEEDFGELNRNTEAFNKRIRQLAKDLGAEMMALVTEANITRLPKDTPPEVLDRYMNDPELRDEVGHDALLFHIEDTEECVVYYHLIHEQDGHKALDEERHGGKQTESFSWSEHESGSGLQA